MAKRKAEEPPKGAPAWQSTFADLMNLLLCFFVMLFAMSDVDKQKFELIAASFTQSFSVFSGGAQAVGDGILISNGVSQLNELDEYMTTMGRAAEQTTEEQDKWEEIEEEQLKESESLSELIEEALQEQNLEGMVDVDFTSQYVSLTLNGALLFDSGSAQIKTDSLPILDKIGVILRKYGKSIIEIEGHTDNVPIHTSRFADNNELSSARALSVFNYLVENSGLDPAIVKHTGRGEYVPIADNSTETGRAKNRRVEIKIYHTLSTY
ncbi:MAG: flagellar motor protein MotB [Lachnospiraceae bacterium]|nr:flagellar motor protein MotB [Lachnospiraceae bacterium]